MDSRERTFLALDHKPGDRIPIDFWATPAVIQGLEQTTGLGYSDFLDKHDVDLRYIEGPEYIGPPLEPGMDLWGVKRGTVTAKTANAAEAYSEVTRAPLLDAQSAEDVIAYSHWPSPDWYDYSIIEKQCDALQQKGRVVCFMGDRLNRIAQFKPAMYLRGTEEIFMDLAGDPDLAQAIFGKIKGFYLAYLDRILTSAKGKIDIIVTGDDFGAQNGCLVSPDMWREHLKPGFGEFLKLIKNDGVRSMHHTCGSVRDIVPDIIECGLDILQSCQPEATGMSLSGLKEDFGGQLCFQGGVSIQKTMPYGTPDDVSKEVAGIGALFRDEGGYIFCTSHNIQADTPVENTLALLEAYHKFGRKS